MGAWGDWLAFAIPPLCLGFISVGGQLPYGEIVVLIMLPYFLMTQRDKIFRKEYRTAYLLLALWILSQSVTDMYVGAPFDNRIKGLARVVFFGLDFAFLSVLIGRDRRRMIAYFLGSFVTVLLGAFSQGMGGFGVLWKMGLGTSSTVVLFLALPIFVKRSKFLPYAIAFFVFAVINLRFGIRSGVMFDAAALLLLLPVFGGVPGVKMEPSVRWAKIAALFVFMAGAAWASQKVIHWAVNAGLYEDTLSNKFETQSSGKLGVIFGGRPEAPVALRAIADSPILGHGSYAADPKYNVLLQDYQYELGYSDTDTTDEDAGDNIPTHSHLTLAWVEGGFFASFFWFYMLALCVRCILKLTDSFHPYKAAFIYSFIALFWDILFSPYGYTRRLNESVLLIIMLNLLNGPAGMLAYSAPLEKKTFPYPTRRPPFPAGPPLYARSGAPNLRAAYPSYPRNWRNFRPRLGGRN